MKKIISMLLTVLLLTGCMLTISACNRNPVDQKAPSAQKAPPAGESSSTPKALSDEKYFGKYIDETNPQNYTELKSNGTFTVHQRGANSSGIYLITGTKLVFYLSSGEAVEGTIEGKSIIGKNGGRSTKQ